VGDVLIKEKIATTEAKAKAIRPLVEKMITLGKKGTLASRRLLEARLPRNGSAMKVAKELASRYATRSGGYVRIIKLPSRPGDGARMALIELV
jgi:large subunit ribosomal protein L17